VSGSIFQLFTVTSVLFLKCRVGVPFIVLSEPLQSARFYCENAIGSMHKKCNIRSALIAFNVFCAYGFLLLRCVI
jgi:hypothetical protein